jgi:hypothetical protein
LGRNFSRAVSPENQPSADKTDGEPEEEINRTKDRPEDQPENTDQDEPDD